MKLIRTKKMLIRYGSWLLSGLLRTWASTWRVQRTNVEDLRAVCAQGPVIFSFFHNQLLFAPFSVPDGPPFRPVATLISASDDGSLIANAVAGLGVVPVRGSSSRKSKEAKSELDRALENGTNIGITPDGPKGPVYKLKNGIVALSRTHKVPVVSIQFRASRCIRVGSWDRFVVPMPFSRIECRFGEPIYPEEDEGFEAYKSRLESRLRSDLNAVDPASRALV